MSQHTPGPWISIMGIDDDAWRWGVYVDGATHYHIATIENGAPGDTLETEGANARLIAAAPDLLEVLKGITEVIDLSKMNVRKDFSLLVHHAAALNVIAKAEGRG